jgi:hypothetical protein
MNHKAREYAKYVSILAIAIAFVISSAMPLLADPPQSSQPSNAASQKNDDSLPDAPQSQSTQNQQESSQAPGGAAGAKAANPKGAPVAQPAGAAVAPVRQRGHRSLLIKVGLVAGGAIAVGTAVALSERSPSRPPGASPSTAQR